MITPTTGQCAGQVSDWRLETGDWRLETGDWRLETGDYVVNQSPVTSRQSRIVGQSACRSSARIPPRSARGAGTQRDRVERFPIQKQFLKCSRSRRPQRRENNDWRLETGDWRLETGDWRLETGDWRLRSHQSPVVS